MMRFTESEIDWALQLRAAGLLWSPEVGHYVFDINGMVRAGSPFQAGVHLIHSTNAFEALAGGREELLENFVWLPTWEEARNWLGAQGIGAERIVEAWRAGLAEGLSDRECLYRLMLEVLQERRAEGG